MRSHETFLLNITSDSNRWPSTGVFLDHFCTLRVLRLQEIFKSDGTLRFADWHPTSSPCCSFRQLLLMLHQSALSYLNIEDKAWIVRIIQCSSHLLAKILGRCIWKTGSSRWETNFFCDRTTWTNRLMKCSIYSVPCERKQAKLLLLLGEHSSKRGAEESTSPFESTWGLFAKE